MPVLNIEGRRVRVDDKFLTLSPEDQQATVEDIHRQLQESGKGQGQDDGGGVLRSVDDFMRGAADTSSFGLADEISAGAGALTGIGGKPGDYRGNLAAQRQRDREGGWSRTAGQVAGAFLNPVSVGSKLLGEAGTLGGAAVRGAIDGAIFGSLYGAGSGEDAEDRARQAVVGGATGGVVGAAAPYVAAGISKAFGRNKPVIPGLDEINAAKNAAYDAADRAGVIYTPQAVGRLSENVTAKLTDMGYDPSLHPGAAAVVRRLREVDGQNVTMKGLDTIRKVASNGYIPGNKPNNRAISEIINSIDDAMTKPHAGDVLMGDARTGMKALMDARNLASRVSKMERVKSAVERAELRAASTGSGGNADNATRQNLRRLLENPRGFTPDEQKALSAVVRGTPVQNAARLAGKFAPTGVVSGVLSGGAGYGLLGPAGPLLPLAGMGAKAAADKMTQSNVGLLSEIIAAGGTKAATQAAKTPTQAMIEGQSGNLARLLSGLGLPLIVDH